MTSRVVSRLIAVLGVLSMVLASANAVAAERDVCRERMGCCMQDDEAMAQPCGGDAQRLERTCCCVVAPVAPAATAPLPPTVERSQQELPPSAGMALAEHPTLAVPATTLARLPEPPDRGPPPAARSLFGQRIALLR